MTELDNFLRRFGITKRYMGYKRIYLVLQLALENEDRLEAITKELYMAVADRLDCSWEAVERSIRTVVRTAWQTNPQLLAKLAGYPLTQAPTASEFIEISVNYLQRTVPTAK